MSILIRDMEMPKNCQECACINDEYFYCQAVNRQPQDENVISRRPDWCPLIEVPPHGRLIDADALLRDFPIRADHYDKEHGNAHFVYGVETVMDYVGEMPTIIEAEE